MPEIYNIAHTFKTILNIIEALPLNDLIQMATEIFFSAYAVKVHLHFKISFECYLPSMCWNSGDVTENSPV